MGASTGNATGAQDPASAASLANAGAGIATGLATGGPIGGLIATGLAATSFIQASKQMKLQREAEQNATKALEEAKRQININPFDALGINKEAYEREREALLAQGAQAIAAGQEGDRGAAATAGRIQLAQNEAQGAQRDALNADLLNLEKMSAEEDAKIKTNLAQISLSEAEGYNKQSEDAAKARAMAIQQGYQTGAKALEYGLGQVPLIIGRGKGNDTNKTDNQGQVSSIPNVQKPSGAQQVPSSKLNVSSFQTMPSWKSLAEQQMYNNTNFNEGSKLGSGFKTPNWSDAYNYFKF
jgi:hypothetical protein